jgi:hypothetical protein
MESLIDRRPHIISCTDFKSTKLNTPTSSNNEAAITNLHRRRVGVL